ncbi:hypothetical protein GCM10023210_33090 [Chryseobacterium ginsengisoli]|uniref:Phage abortive infection protein n=1 Tax=Chryseobacterium ginsengisoli TaxID=363853 RepID=A0ABP9MMW7_9FLAO
MSENNKEKDLNLKTISVFTTIGIIVLWLISYLVFYGFHFDKDPNNIGDSFGAINSLFSGLALAGIILTILMQKKELEYQRKELELTRDEMVRTRKEFETQNLTLSKQQFENTFFQMISLFTNIVEHSNYVNQNYNVTGRDVFDTLLKKYNDYAANHINNENIKIGGVELTKNPNLRITEKNIDRMFAVSFYNLVYFNHKNILGHYFRTLYHIIKLIDNTDDINKRFYISIIRSQLSSSEQVLLFYNCLHANGNKFFKPLVEKYTLFKNIDISLIINKELKKEYAETAFKRLE